MTTRQPSKEYRARIWVKLTDDMLPSPVMSAAELQSHLAAALNPGGGDSPIVSVVVEDPRTTTTKRY